jgi:hypothetical protein
VDFLAVTILHVPFFTPPLYLVLFEYLFFLNTAYSAEADLTCVYADVTSFIQNEWYQRNPFQGQRDGSWVYYSALYMLTSSVLYCSDRAADNLSQTNSHNKPGTMLHTVCSKTPRCLWGSCRDRNWDNCTEFWRINLTALICGVLIVKYVTNKIHQFSWGCTTSWSIKKLDAYICAATYIFPNI